MTDSSDSNYIVNIKTVQSSALRTLVECMKEILTDVNWVFDKTGIKVLCMDGNHVSLVSLKLDAANFETYECVSKITIGMNMTNFFKLIKSVNNNDTIALRITTEDPNKLIIVIENVEKNSITDFKLKLLDIEDEKIDIPKTEFDTVITMPSSDLQRLCRDMQVISDVMTIESYENTLKLSCKGDFAEQSTTIQGAANNGTQLTPSANQSGEIVRGTFSLKYLNLFTKGSTNLCSIVELLLKNDYPLLLKFAVASLGHIMFCLAPKIEDE